VARKKRLILKKKNHNQCIAMSLFSRAALRDEECHAFRDKASASLQTWRMYVHLLILCTSFKKVVLPDPEEPTTTVNVMTM
jgi:hypothetical protein